MNQNEGSPAVESPETAAIHCDLCGAPMIDFNCELVCLKCGFRRDCSDP
jgi:hypothetical protein